ncbi:hypothetical protein F8M41_007197 [Gigaspora margarita]|uniref:Uncharacterized protein n=1 Tax=Gigaspora margarita TaxID=4874 RepID=A0A8H3X6W3_GIGMA|nr:hypothetical protein F8M41_007197 [Gigaspora margarita]
MCKKFVENEANNSSVNLDALSGAEFGEWLDRPEKLQQLTAQMGEEGSLASALRKGSLKIARRPDYMTFAKLGTNTGFEIFYLETGRPNSTLAKQLCDHKKLVCMSKDSIDTTRNISQLQRVFNKSIKRELLAIFTGDVLELYTMHKESGIYKYGLLGRAPIPLRLTSHNNVYSLIYTLLTLRGFLALQ